MFTQVPITAVHESKTNPRSQFTKLEELAESIKAVGIIQPLTVVKNAHGYEIVAGARRYRAAKLAGLETLPVTVRELTQEQILEVQIIENLQRDDVHPLDEAKGYEQLMKESHWKVEKVAEKVGKSVKYVYDRVKLLGLCKEARDSFWKGDITAGHAILLARLSRADQLKAMGLESKANELGGLWQAEHIEHHRDSDHYEHAKKAVSVRELQGWINDYVRFDVKAVEPMLFPETAGTIAKAQEQAEQIIPITHDHYVQPDVKDGNRIWGPQSWRRADGQHGTKPCNFSVIGVIVAGPGRGESFRVCTEKKDCLIHWKAEIKAREKRQQGAGGEKKPDKWELERKRQEEERKRDEERHEAYTKALPAISAALAESVKKAPTKSTGLLAEIVLKKCATRDGWGREGIKKCLAALPDDRSSLEGVLRTAAWHVLIDELTSWGAHRSEAKKLLKSFNLKLEDYLKPEPAADPEKAAGKKKGKAA